MNGEHIPVLLAEVLDLLSPQPGEVVLDGTVGGGGHAAALLGRVMPGGRLIGLDRDEAALGNASQVLSAQGSAFVLEQANFAEVAVVLDKLGLDRIDVALVDLGMSSFQVDDPDRGFGFRSDGPLDMRMDRRQATTAADLVNTLAEEALADVFYRYGEERMSRRIARRIVEARQTREITTTAQLAQLVVKAQPSKHRGRRWRIHPATRVFQSLRIAVNCELENLEVFCRSIVDRLSVGGRLGIISFHSLEDRIVKRTFRQWASEDRAEIVTRKPVTCSANERQRNPRSRSAKLRVARRTGASHA